ncbi:MAG: aminotransferase class I/II-fold pyridoxal phosphate-dependent enzyme [Gemmatimonadetes bacterium]|nr:aminotransferase class I/II-fold pyridoxal phosphate-dependent enzyme [Gemmatimonadota bacterium]MYB60713.1 aminotransferase class I/II-fold pyridoxal phosphate-dependent enzyme [Gemmatimonadota bacterium]
MSNMLKAMNLAAPGFTRRKFLKGLAVGAGVASLGSYEAAAQMVAGPRVRPVRGWGVPEGFIRLSSNENPIGPSPRAVEAIMQYVYKFNRYYRGRGLYGQIAERHGLPVVIPSNNNEDRTEPWVTLGCGSSEVLFAIASAYLRDGGQMIEAAPGYGGVVRTARNYGARARLVRTTPDFHQDLDAMKAAITEDTRVVVITSPGNPTGIIVPFDDLKKFVSGIPSDVMVFVDEAYIEFARNPQDRIGAAPLILDHENVIVTRTFSKIMGMAGLRIGYGLARPHVIEKLEDNKGGRVSSLSVVAAEACIEDQDYQDRARAAAWAGHDYLTGQFEEMGLEYVPSQSSFMLVNVRTDADEVTRKLFEEYNVLVGNGKRRWRMNNWLRVTAGLQAENEAFIAALKKVLVSS